MQPNKFNRTLAGIVAGTSGSVTLLFAISFLAMMLFVGLALDYGRATAREQVLKTAADAAVLAALSTATSDYAANASAAKLLADAQKAANGAFIANAGANYALLKATPTVTVQRAGQVVTASVSYQARSPNAFGELVNVNQMNYAGALSSSMTLPGYLNFYLVLDVSESMGIPSTSSEIERLAAINPDFLNLYPGGCTIACHFTNYQACQNANGNTTWCQGYNLTRTAGNSSNTPVSYCPTPGTNACIQLRLDAVAYATQQLIQTATTTHTLTNQFGIGLYPFAAQLEAYQPLTTNLATVTTAAAGLTGLIDNGNPTGVGSGGTHFENALTSINSTITTIGDGSSPSSPQPFVFLVTDGAQDNQYQWGRRQLERQQLRHDDGPGQLRDPQESRDHGRRALCALCADPQSDNDLERRGRLRQRQYPLHSAGACSPAPRRASSSPPRRRPTSRQPCRPCSTWR